jgi:hypothetical protein
MKLLTTYLFWVTFVSVSTTFAAEIQMAVTESGKYAGVDALIAETHQKSLTARNRELQKTVAAGKSWLPAGWGDTNWSLAALYLNERVTEANDKLLEQANLYRARYDNTQQPGFEPGKESNEFPWSYFGLVDYIRILCLFRAESPHYPGRLTPATEAAMKEALWIWAKDSSRVADAALDNLLVLLGTENHDLTLRPAYYLLASILKDDPAYSQRHYGDGKTAREHYNAYNTFFQEWPRQRARCGLWVELGSDTYQKYSWPALFNLHELSPDPIVRKRFGMLLDLAFIEEAQISINGRRGGGLSRAGHHGGNNFERYKNLLYVPEGERAYASHSKVIETSRYQLPATAIILRRLEFPAEEPFVIANRVLGELAPGEGHRLTADSALVNYAYRTPHSILGSTLQNPSLSMPDPTTGNPTLKYTGISRQNRWCGVLFADKDLSAIYPVIEKTRGGRPQHPYWSFQHRNVMLMQRITPTKKGLGSYSTGKISIRFKGSLLEKIEQNGWIFASNGRAYAGVRFLDSSYEWDKPHEVAGPVGHDNNTSTSRILFHTGDIQQHGSFEQFQQKVIPNQLVVTKDKIEYIGGVDKACISFFRYTPAHATGFKLPEVNGTAVNLRPKMTYNSPYIQGVFGQSRIKVSVGPVKRVYDFDDR